MPAGDAPARGGGGGGGTRGAAALASLVLLGVGAAGFRALEGWGAVDCVYAAAGVLTTVGLVVPPRTAAGAAWAAALNVASLGACAVALGDISDARRAWMGARGALRGRAAAALVLGVAAPWAAATLALSALEGWPLPTSAFLALCCATGLGMADVAPRTSAGKLALAAYVVASMGAALHLCAAIGAAVVDAAAPAARAIERARGGAARRKEGDLATHAANGTDE